MGEGNPRAPVTSTVHAPLVRRHQPPPDSRPLEQGPDEGNLPRLGGEDALGELAAVGGDPGCLGVIGAEPFDDGGQVGEIGLVEGGLGEPG